MSVYIVELTSDELHQIRDALRMAGGVEPVVRPSPAKRYLEVLEVLAAQTYIAGVPK